VLPPAGSLPALSCTRLTVTQNRVVFRKVIDLIAAAAELDFHCQPYISFLFTTPQRCQLANVAVTILTAADQTTGDILPTMQSGIGPCGIHLRLYKKGMSQPQSHAGRRSVLVVGSSNFDFLSIESTKNPGHYYRLDVIASFREQVMIEDLRNSESGRRAPESGTIRLGGVKT